MSYFVVKPDTDISTIKARSAQRDQHFFPIVDDQMKYKGLISLKDIDSCEGAFTAIEVLNQCGDTHIFALEDEPLEKAKIKLKENNLQFLPVVSSDFTYIGSIDYSSI